MASATSPPKAIRPGPAMMILPAVLAMLIGVAAGTRCNVLILVPLFVTGLAAMVIVILAHNTGLWSVAFGSGLMLTTLQIGYLVGMAARFVRFPTHRMLPAVAAAARQPAR